MLFKNESNFLSAIYLFNTHEILIFLIESSIEIQAIKRKDKKLAIVKIVREKNLMTLQIIASDVCKHFKQAGYLRLKSKQTQGIKAVHRLLRNLIHKRHVNITLKVGPNYGKEGAVFVRTTHLRLIHQGNSCEHLKDNYSPCNAAKEDWIYIPILSLIDAIYVFGNLVSILEFHQVISHLLLCYQTKVLIADQRGHFPQGSILVIVEEQIFTSLAKGRCDEHSKKGFKNVL